MRLVRGYTLGLGKQQIGQWLQPAFARDVRAGQVLTCDDVRSVRPSAGLHPRHMPAVLGRIAARDVSAATPLAWDMVGEAPSADVSLRVATADDSARLLAWRNDAETRAQSLRPDEVSASDHEAWLSRSLASDERALFVAERDGAAARAHAA